MRGWDLTHTKGHPWARNGARVREASPSPGQGDTGHRTACPHPNGRLTPTPALCTPREERRRCFSCRCSDPADSLLITLFFSLLSQEIASKLITRFILKQTNKKMACLDIFLFPVLLKFLIALDLLLLLFSNIKPAQFGAARFESCPGWSPPALQPSRPLLHPRPPRPPLPVSLIREPGAAAHRLRRGAGVR